MSIEKHLNIKIYGDVHGVGFRYSVREKAEQLDIKGFVQNMADGTVYIEAEGEENNLKILLNWCKVGPYGALVEKVDFEFSEKIKGFEKFIIKY